MVPAIRKTSELVQEIAAVSEEQLAGVEQVNCAISQLSQTMQMSAAAAAELSSTAEEMSASAIEMQQLMARFDTGVFDDAQRPGRTGSTTRRVVVPGAAPLSKPDDESKFQPFRSVDKSVTQAESSARPVQPGNT